MKTPVNAVSLKHHLTYNWWKYVLALLAGTMLVNLVFTVTTPRVPEEKKVEFYVFGYADQVSLNAYMEDIRLRDMLEMESMTSTVSYPDDTYGAMILTTYVAANEGDLYLLPRDDFLSLSSSGAFLPLEEDEELMDVFNEAGIDLRRGWRTLSDSDETHLYGIPMDTLPGLSSLCWCDNGYLAVTAYGGNTDNTLLFLRILCSDMITAPAAETSAAPEEAAADPAAGK